MGRFESNANNACNKYDEVLGQIRELQGIYGECLGYLNSSTGIDEAEKIKQVVVKMRKLYITEGIACFISSSEEF